MPQAGDKLVREMREEMEVLKAEHRKSMESLLSKIEWYRENQEIIDRNDKLLNEQSDLIRRLKAKLEEYEGALFEQKLYKNHLAVRTVDYCTCKIQLVE